MTMPPPTTPNGLFETILLLAIDARQRRAFAAAPEATLASLGLTPEVCAVILARDKRALDRALLADLHEQGASWAR
jgi:hypothetical protein